MDFELRTGKMSFLEFSQKNTLFEKTNYSMFHYSLRVIDEPKMSDSGILNLRHKKSILVDIYRQSLLSSLVPRRSLLTRCPCEVWERAGERTPSQYWQNTPDFSAILPLVTFYEFVELHFGKPARQ